MDAEGVVMIDQRILPAEEKYVVCRDYVEVADAIREMVIRGAPAIGCAAAMGVAIGVLRQTEATIDEAFPRICETLARTRPTAVNLFWAIDRMRRLFERLRAEGRPFAEIQRELVAEAQRLLTEDIEINRAMGRHGAALLPQGAT